MFNAIKKRLFGEGPAKPLAAEPAAPQLSPAQAAAEAARLLAQGNALLDQGKPGQAAECYRRATQLKPTDASAFINLGFALTEQGLHADAEAPLRQATVLDPNSVDAHYVLGTSFNERGDAHAAIESYLRAIALKPDFPSCRLELCRLLVSAGKTEQAKEVISAGIALSPSTADFHFYKANLLVTEGALEQAIVSFRDALSIAPDHHQALANLGAALHGAGEFDTAVDSFEKAILLRPGDAAVHCRLAVTLLAQGKLDDGVQHYRAAIAINPEYAEAHCDLATTLQVHGRLDEAIEHYRKAVSIKPDFADALSNLGTTLQSKGRLTEAIDILQRALKVNENHAAAHNNLGNAFHEMDRLEESVACFMTALRINPDYPDAHANLGGVQQEQCELDAAIRSYKRTIELKPDFPDVQSNLLFALNYHPDLSDEAIFAAYSDYDRRAGSPLRAQWKAHGNSRDSARRMRIGYVSPDMRQHSVTHFLEPLMAHHDKGAVEVFAYAELAQEDAATQRYRGYADHWVATLGMKDDALAERIRTDHIDILVDLAGHTAKNRLGVFARKPAPVSVTWMGFGYTTGLSAIDYMLTDAVAAPPGSEHLFSEKPWRLPHPPYAVFRPAEGMGEVSALPALERGFVTFGTLTRAVRINHRTIRVWAQILKRVPDALLVVDSKNFQDSRMRASLEAKFAAHGVGPERLDLGFHSPPWDVLRGLDIGLDCFPHNSGTTLFETLYMGVPFVTLADRPSVGRLGSSILHGVGRPQWIAQTEEEYVEIAVGLASDLSALAAVRENLRPQMEASALRDERGFARSVEVAYRDMFAVWVKGASAAR